MSRHTPRSMLGLAMLLVGTGAECASAAPQVDEQEQRRMKWASDRAVSRIYSIEEMRQYLRNCGDDEARAEENLPRLDEWTRKVGVGALSLLTAATRLAEQRRKQESSKAEYRRFDAHGIVTHAATIAGPPMVAPGWSVPLSVVSTLDAPPVSRQVKPAVIAANVERRRNGGGCDDKIPDQDVAQTRYVARS